MPTLRPLGSIRCLLALLLSLLLIATPALRADVTVRYKNDFKLGKLIPPNIAQQNLNEFKDNIVGLAVLQIKGGKMYSNFGRYAVVLDSSSQEVTLVDSAHKQFATTYFKDYLDELSAAIPAMPSKVQDIMNTLKVNFSSLKTGQTEMILGVQAEESELTLSVDMPLPPGVTLPAAAPGGQPISMMKMVMQIWIAAPPEIARVPALAEWSSYKSSSATYFQNPLSGMQKFFDGLPGVGKAFAPVVEEFSKNQGLLLKTHTEVYAPILAQLVPILRAQGTLPPDFDPAAPLMETDSEAAELSSADIDDSVFQVPSDYRATPLADLMKSLMPPAGKLQPSPEAP